jgi:hypothetical protein
MTASSQSLWRLVPLAELIQFPWRLLSLTALAFAVLGGTAVGAVSLLTVKGEEEASKSGLSSGPGSSPSHPALYVLPLVILLASLPYTVPQYTEVTARDESLLAVIDFELEFPDMRGMTAWSDHLPQPEDSPLVAQYLSGEPLTKARIVRGQGDVESLRHGGASDELLVTSPDGVQVQFYTYWFPGWRVRVDGEVVESWPQGPNGLITFEVPSGEHRVELRMTESTVPRRVGGILSGMTLALTLALHWAGKRQIRTA